MRALPGLSALLAGLLMALPALAQPAPGRVAIGYLALVPPRTVPLTLLDPPPTDEGVQGARVALQDNQTTGRFLN